MTDFLTPKLLEAIENKFLAEKENRQQSWLERSEYKLEVMKFRDALNRSEQQTKAEFMLMLYNKYYFSPTLIGNIVNKSSKVVWLWLEEWAFENEESRG